MSNDMVLHTTLTLSSCVPNIPKSQFSYLWRGANNTCINECHLSLIFLSLITNGHIASMPQSNNMEREKGGYGPKQLCLFIVDLS